MTSDKLELNSAHDNEGTERKKLNWYWGLVYLASWFALYFIAIYPSFNAKPKMLYISDEAKHPNSFIGERAQLQLLNLSSIGIKLTGTVENEVLALNFLIDEVNKIKANSRTDLYDIEIDVQYSSGSFFLWSMPTSYHNVVNLVVKLSPKRKKSDTYLLLNSHFDSEVNSPGVGDDGIMVVIMLEIMRAISISEKNLNNPIVFLFNGAEEANLLGSHGFITQHKWAKNCKVVINLDSAGSGGREVLFQSGPNHRWLMELYKKNVKYPFANTIAEEMFQSGFVPSDSDFRIFRDYGNLPGLDMAHFINGYIYHTKHDTFSNIASGSYQITGENVLALTYSLANSEEIQDIEAHEGGHSVFYDYLGWFTIEYREGVGIFFNVLTICGCFLTVSLSLREMTMKAKNPDSPKKTIARFFTIFLIVIGTHIISIGYTAALAAILNAVGCAETWYTQNWLLFGLYYCPTLFFVGVCPAIYLHYTKGKNGMTLKDNIISVMHSHVMILTIMCIVLQSMGIRSSYFPMISMFFYTISDTVRKLLGLIIKYDISFILFMIAQLANFWFYAYIAYASNQTFVPMEGRSGPTSTPDMMIALSAALMTLHVAGFILPTMYRVRKSITLLSVFGVIHVIYLIIAVTPAGFPYKADVSFQRFYTLHTNRVFHDAGGLVVKNESGFYVQPVDARPWSLDDTTFKNRLPQSWVDEQCKNEMFCGMPLYNTRWMEWVKSARWIPAAAPNLLIPVKLTLEEKVFDTSLTRIRYRFSLKSADRAVIYIEPYEGVKVLNWSFDKTPLEKSFVPPYFMYHCYSMDDTPLSFWVEVERSSSQFTGNTMRLGVGAHYLYHQHAYTTEFKEFLASYPDWAYTSHWFASYENWIY